jgi:hypothetical protein
MTAVVVIFVVAMYFLPTILAAARKHPSTGAVAVINFFFGWTVIGWILALAKAAGNAGRGGVTVQQTIVHHAPSQMPMDTSGHQPVAPAPPRLERAPGTAAAATPLPGGEPL